MSLLEQSMTANALVPLSSQIEVLQPTSPANPHYVGSVSVVWSNATVTSTVLGTIHPASTRALERVGRVGKVGVHEIIMQPVSVTPLGRVRSGDQQFMVLDVRVWGAFTHAVVEEVSV